MDSFNNNERIDKNDGKFRIQTDQNAQDAWELFFNRFSSFTLTGLESEPEFDETICEFTPRLNKNDKKSHSDDFEDFLNGHTIQIPKKIKLTKKGMEIFLKDIRKGNYNAEIFKHDEHIFYALWAFKLNKITRQQVGTILTRNLLCRIEKSDTVKIIKLLKPNGKYTKEGKKIISDILNHNDYYHFTKQDFEILRLLLKAAPLTEQVIFLTKSQNISQDRGTLKKALDVLHSWDQYEEYDVFFSIGLMDALEITKLGVYGSWALRMVLGEIKQLDRIEHGIQYQYRPASITLGIEGVGPQPPETIHDYVKPTMIEGIKHDEYHQKLHGTIPSSFRFMLRQLKNIISAHTKIKWSKAMWNITDSEFHFFKDSNNPFFSKKDCADHFTLIFFSEKSDTPQLLNNRELTDEGIAVIWHMVNHQDVWENLYKIDVASVKSGLNYISRDKCFSQIEELKTYIDKDEDPRIINLKYRLYSFLQKHEFDAINAIINELKPDLLEAERFKFTKKNNYKGQKNIIVLELDNLIVSEDNCTALMNNLKIEHENFNKKQQYTIHYNK